MKNKALTIRVDEELHAKAIELAEERQQTLTDFLRQAVQSECDQTQSEGNQTQSSPPEPLMRHLDNLERQIDAKDQQIHKLQDALDQSQQLQAMSEKRYESQQLQLEEYQRPKPLMARLKAVFVAE